MPDVDDFKPPTAAETHPRRWAWLAALAKRQHGVVARWQLRKLGFTRGELAGLVDRAHLHPLHRGVYAVGHRKLTTKGRWMAAVLACGPGAVLSHRAAIALWELRPVPSGPIDVTVAARSRRPRQGIRLHNVRSLHDDDRDTVEGIPVTSLHRTLLDYAQTAWEQHLRHAVDAAERRERLDARKLEALYERSRGHHGIGALKAAVARLRGSPPWTRSELERRFLALIRDAGLPEPQTNVLIEGELVDCFWPEAALIVEVDSYEFHKSRAQFDADRRRDAKLMVAGYRVLRVTQPRVEFGARALVSDLRALLALPAGR